MVELRKSRTADTSECECTLWFLGVLEVTRQILWLSGQGLGVGGKGLGVGAWGWRVGNLGPLGYEYA